MKTLQTDFEQMVRLHRSTIYTVCLMFSKDADEVNDLFHHCEKCVGAPLPYQGGVEENVKPIKLAHYDK